MTAQQTTVERARRVVAMSALAAKEYGEGVVDGRVVLAEEVDEARLFLREARATANELADPHRASITGLLDSSLAVVERIGEPAALHALASRLHESLRAAYGNIDEVIPALRPDERLGRRVFEESCARCHGDTGRGDGVSGADLNPPPSDLTDPFALADQSPLDTYRKVQVGVSGTDMPAFEESLTSEQAWAVTWYVTGLRGATRTERGREVIEGLCEGCNSEANVSDPFAVLPDALVDPAVAARLTDEDLWAEVRSRAPASVDSSGVADAVAFLRDLPFAPAGAEGARGTFVAVRSELARAFRRARAGEASAAASAAFDAYATFENVETQVALRNGALATRLERRFAELRGRLGGAYSVDALAGHYDALLADLDTAEGVLSDGRPSRAQLMLQSFIIMVREGIEAILLVGALVALVVQAGAADRKREIWIGVGAAVVASVMTAIAFETIFRIGVAEQEALEGFTMLAAAAVLISVSYWLLSKIEVKHWNAYVSSRITRGISTGSAVTLGAAAFLAVYREGFETVLFYKALFITAEGQGTGAIGAGVVAACIVLGLIYMGIARYGLRIPLRPFFAVTSAVLLYLAFTFAGKGIAELQESRLVSTTLLEWGPRLPWAGIYPTVETLLIQGALLLMVVGGLAWTFGGRQLILPKTD